MSVVVSVVARIFWVFWGIFGIFREMAKNLGALIFKAPNVWVRRFELPAS